MAVLMPDRRWGMRGRGERGSGARRGQWAPWQERLGGLIPPSSRVGRLLNPSTYVPLTCPGRLPEEQLPREQTGMCGDGSARVDETSAVWSGSDGSGRMYHVSPVH
jgi:hypothetical protein